MITVNDAKLIIDNHVHTKGIEKVNLDRAESRILASDAVAKIPSPLFDNSAMDGFAIKYLDIDGATKNNPVKLKLASISSAGAPTNIVLKHGECIQCMTGAKIPTGADSIVMVEKTSGFNNEKVVDFFSETLEGSNIRRQGEEVKKGELLIPKGTKITPNEIGILAAFGYGSVSVYKRPKIAIFGTGDELVEPGNELKPGQIYNSNLYVMADLVKESGSKVITKEVIKDDKNALRLFLKEAIEQCDIIISSGGVSMGKYDYVRDVFIELGVEERFWKVAQKPGKPLFFGNKSSTLIFGLPGNPVSSYIGFMIWVWPVLEKMMGLVNESFVFAKLKMDFPTEKHKHRFLFGQVWLEKGTLVCKPSLKLGSHMLSSSKNANCIISAEKSDNFLKSGSQVKIKLLPWKNIKWL